MRTIAVVSGITVGASMYALWYWMQKAAFRPIDLWVIAAYFLANIGWAILCQLYARKVRSDEYSH